MASVKESLFNDSGTGWEDAMAASSFFAFCISLLSMLPWAVFFPVWGPSFDGQEGLRLALSVSSLVVYLIPTIYTMMSLVAWFVSPTDSVQHSSNVNRIYGRIVMTFWVCGMYIIEKVLVVLIIYSLAIAACIRMVQIMVGVRLFVNMVRDQ